MQADRFGPCTSQGWSIGTGRRTSLADAAHTSSSPGPVYLPHKNTSMTPNPVQTSFGTDGVMGRYKYSAAKRRNDPFWNPSAAHYTPVCPPQGGVIWKLITIQAGQGYTHSL